MTFREQLDRAHKLAIDIGSAYIAQEVAEYEGFCCVLTPEEFEHICQVIYDMWVELSYPVAATVDTIGKLISTHSYKPLEVDRTIVMENYHEI